MQSSLSANVSRTLPECVCGRYLFSSSMISSSLMATSLLYGQRPAGPDYTPRPAPCLTSFPGLSEEKIDEGKDECEEECAPESGDGESGDDEPGEHDEQRVYHEREYAERDDGNREREDEKDGLQRDVDESEHDRKHE